MIEEIRSCVESPISFRKTLDNPMFFIETKNNHFLFLQVHHYYLWHQDYNTQYPQLIKNFQQSNNLKNQLFYFLAILVWFIRFKLSSTKCWFFNNLELLSKM